MDRYVFPALFESEEGIEGYTVSFPDLSGCHTEGDSLEDALTMAKEALGLHLYSMEEDGDSIPVPSNIASLPSVEDGFYTLIEVRTGPIRDKQLNRSVTKNVTLPRWLELEATAAQLNYSQVLQHALKQELGIVEKQQN
ncbi:type II toxin-antitoxin system HicB family antitoxin [Paenibacillus sp. MZ04-78.2]|uniref:type II toxin-antitoxin system HicB family antitoxin n=1 Tax=Paenibacillus sp. MZ04-78.2 TaxID=2962034 RepID=UPI0020B6A6C0|nr:type II toxin-antitoxin system HicB family antitoxin [Paenibacillus sp. MZ04-78.2]MCP3773343.1 type II toxin-antitoxin system HicB family antitoxin [Paenibacillus sp. MZ04-78.2]